MMCHRSLLTSIVHNCVIDNKSSRGGESGDMFFVLSTFSEQVESKGLLSEGEDPEGGEGRERSKEIAPAITLDLMMQFAERQVLVSKVCARTRTRTRTHTHAHTHTYTRARAHTHTHTPLSYEIHSLLNAVDCQYWQHRTKQLGDSGERGVRRGEGSGKG